MSELPHATLHLRVLGETRSVRVQIPPTPAQMSDLLPAARAVTNETMSVAISQSNTTNNPVSCRRGCDHCCYQVVGVTAPEARTLAKLVDDMPEPRRSAVKKRFNDTLAIVRANGVMDRDSPEGAPVMILHKSTDPNRNPYIDMASRYHALKRPCPFLEDSACSIYENRPLICREYVVTSPPEHCATLNYPAIKMVPPPVRLSDGLAEIAALIESRPTTQIPLFAALAWAALPENTAPAPNISGPDLLKLLAKWIDHKSTVPLEERK